MGWEITSVIKDCQTTSNERKKKQQKEKEKERERKENEINWQLGQPRLLSLTTFWVNNES